MAKSRTIPHASPIAGSLKFRPLKKGATIANHKIRAKIAKRNNRRKAIKNIL